VISLNLDTPREQAFQGANGHEANADAHEHERQTGPLKRSTGTVDAACPQEANQHADESKDVRYVQGQQRSLIPIA
jgi:hypothetical protein